MIPRVREIVSILSRERLLSVSSLPFSRHDAQSRADLGVDSPAWRFVATVGTLEKDPAIADAKQVAVPADRADRLMGVDEDSERYE